MLAPDYPVRTDRLLLRPFDAATDIDAVHAYASRADVCRFIPWEPRTRDEVAEWLPRRPSSMAGAGESIGLAIEVQDTGVLVGDVVLMWHSVEHRAGEIGYVLNPDHRGKGYVTEAARALLEVAFGTYGLHRVVARMDPRNEASAAVARRLGMRQEAYLRENEWFKGEWVDELDFALLEDEWRAL